MSKRKNANYTVHLETDGGEPPNRYVAQVSSHLAVYWPPKASKSEVVTALNIAYSEVSQQIEAYYE